MEFLKGDSGADGGVLELGDEGGDTVVLTNGEVAVGLVEIKASVLVEPVLAGFYLLPVRDLCLGSGHGRPLPDSLVCSELAAGCYHSGGGTFGRQLPECILQLPIFCP